MKVLYALHTSGNGSISRANEIIPQLEKLCDLDIMLSGTEGELELNHFVKYRRKGLNLTFSKKRGSDFLKILQLIKTKTFLSEVNSIPVENYDFVINDFEPLSAWACKNKNIPCIAMSHQFAMLSKKAPNPSYFDPMARLVLKYYAPCSKGFGFHFQNYDDNTFTPIIRTEIRNAYIKNHGHYTVYLPSVNDKKLIRIFSALKDHEWHIFSKQSNKNYSEKNCWIRPVTNYDFISSITTCEGVICSAGFETPAEALYMKKKLLVVPENGKYEQLCNAVALEKLTVPVLRNLKINRLKPIQDWLKSSDCIHIPYEDITGTALDNIFLAAYAQLKNEMPLPGQKTTAELTT